MIYKEIDQQDRTKLKLTKQIILEDFSQQLDDILDGSRVVPVLTTKQMEDAKQIEIENNPVKDNPTPDMSINSLINPRIETNVVQYTSQENIYEILETTQINKQPELQQASLSVEPVNLVVVTVNTQPIIQEPCEIEQINKPTLVNLRDHVIPIPGNSTDNIAKYADLILQYQPKQALSDTYITINDGFKNHQIDLISIKCETQIIITKEDLDTYPDTPQKIFNSIKTGTIKQLIVESQTELRISLATITYLDTHNIIKFNFGEMIAWTKQAYRRHLRKANNIPTYI